MRAKLNLVILWLAIIAGFVIRVYLLPLKGTNDMNTYFNWGLLALKNGLDQAYMGVYFPFQYQLFEFGAWITTKFHIDSFLVFKSMNLFFDCANMFIIWQITKILKISTFYLCIYWLHPWFITVFSLGYVDFQFTFFILSSLYFTIKGTSRNFLIAGFFLGIAFLMKPQVQMILVSFFIYSIVVFIRNKNLKVFQMFIFPMLIYLGYSIYFLSKSPILANYLGFFNNISGLTSAMINWQNEWFTNLLSHGFSTLVFFLFFFAGIFFTLKKETRNYHLAGMFFSSVLFLRPGFIVPSVSAFLVVSIIHAVKNKNARIFQIFIYPVVLFSMLFPVSYLLHPPGEFVLAKSYMNVANAMSCLNANYLNGWFIAAYNLLKPNDAIYSISDKILIGGIMIRYYAILAVFLFIFLFIRRLTKFNSTKTGSYDFLLLAFFTVFIVPNVMTSAHENHLFIATVLMIPFFGVINNIFWSISLHIILILQFVNLYGIYGLYDYKQIDFLTIPYNYYIANLLSYIAVIMFLLILGYFLIHKNKLLIKFYDRILL